MKKKYLFGLLVLNLVLFGCSTPQIQQEINNTDKKNDENDNQNTNNSDKLITGNSINSNSKISNLANTGNYINTGINNPIKSGNKNKPYERHDFKKINIENNQSKIVNGNGNIYFGGYYDIPNGTETKLAGNIKIKNWTIENIELKTDTKGKIIFFEGIKEKIIGKNIKGLQIDSVSGASLSTKSFNEILKEINTKYNK